MSVGLLLGGLAAVAVAAIPALSSGQQLAESSYGERLAELREALADERLQVAEDGAHALLEEVEQRYGPDSRQAAEVLDVLAPALLRNGKRREQRTLLLAERALELRSRHDGPESLTAAESMRNLAMIRQARNEGERAEVLYRRALRIQGEQLGSIHFTVAKTLEYLGDLMADLDRLDEARDMLEQSLEIKRATRGDVDRDVALGLNTLANVVGQLGDWTAACALYEEGAEILRQLPIRDHAAEGRAFHNLGACFHRLGRLEEALDSLSLARDRRTEVYGLHHFTTASTHHEIARVELGRGEYREALGNYELAEAGYLASYGADHRRTGAILLETAALHHEVGDTDVARELLLRAVDAFRRAVGYDHSSYGAALSALGRFELDAGHSGRGHAVLVDALAVLEESLGSHHPSLAPTLANLALAEALAGDREGARRRLSRVRSLLPDLTDERLLVDVLETIARAQLELGALSAADRTANEAFERLSKSFGELQPRAARLHLLQAISRSRAGARAEAYRAALAAAALGTRFMVLTLPALTESGAVEHARVMRQGLFALLDLVDDGPQDADQVEPTWQALVDSRGAVGRTLRRRRQVLQQAADPHLQEIVARWERSRQRLANLLVGRARAASAFPVADLSAMLEATEQMEREIALAISEDWDSRPAPSLDEIRQALPADAVLVAYAAYRSPRLAGETRRYVAFVASRDRRPEVIRLPESEQIDALAAATVTARDEVDYRHFGESLRRAAWDPVAARIGPASLSLIVADGALRNVDFAALPWGDAGYVVEQPLLVHQLVTESDVVELGRSDAAGEGLVAIGGVDFDAHLRTPENRARLESPDPVARDRALSECLRSGRLPPFAHLYGSLEEAREIASIWSETEGGAADVLTAEVATEAAFRRAVAGKRVVHVASHGFVAGRRCHDAGSAHEAMDDPLTAWSGLAFAGANRSSGARAQAFDDGILTGFEISQLSLDSAEWVVLSACHSGAGGVEEQEGTFGLAHAFRLAGARTIVSGVWAVDDEDARQWITVLYESRLREGLSTAEAVRTASRHRLSALRRAGRVTHPRRWAPFFAVGSWL